jgi:diacylglycerol kinase (ATP)
MKRRSRFSIRSRFESIRHAARGFRDMLLTEPNAWVHAILTILALDLAWWLRIDRTSFALVIIAIVMVWVAEAFNTVLEMMADLVVTPQRYSRTVKRAKDIAAGAVLIASVGALAVGLTILGPPLYQRLAPFWAG